MKIIGVDPGKTGALCFVDDVVEHVEFLDMPILKFRNSKAAFVDGFAAREFMARYNPDLITIEMVGTRPEQGIASSGQFMNLYGAVVSVALSLPIPVELVHPNVWKGKFGLRGAAKDVARTRAIKAVPDVAGMLKRKKDIGRADALWIAMYGMSVVGAVHKKR